MGYTLGVPRRGVGMWFVFRSYPLPHNFQLLEDRSHPSRRYRRCASLPPSLIDLSNRVAPPRTHKNTGKTLQNTRRNTHPHSVYPFRCDIPSHPRLVVQHFSEERPNFLDGDLLSADVLPFVLQTRRRFRRHINELGIRSNRRFHPAQSRVARRR